MADSVSCVILKVVGRLTVGANVRPAWANMIEPYHIFLTLSVVFNLPTAG